MFAMTIYNG